MDEWHEGDPAVRYVLEGDRIRLYPTVVVRVTGQAITDDTGVEHRLDRVGESPDIEPMNDFLAHELRVKGEGFVVVEDEILREPEIGGDGVER